MTYKPAKFKVAMFNSLGGDAFALKTLCDFDFGFKVTQNVTHYTLHVADVPTKFEVVMSNSLGGDAFALKYIM